MRKKIKILAFLPLFLSSCTLNTTINISFFAFDTMVDISILEDDKDISINIKNDFMYLSKLCDNFLSYDFNNINYLNQVDEAIELDPILVNLLKLSIDINKDIPYFNICSGSLISKWKSALEEEKILDENIIKTELETIKNTSLDIDGNYVKRIGEGTIDLGGITKGYALDIAYKYLEDNNIEKYLFNAGSSSILLGEKNSNNKTFIVGLKDLDNAYLELKNCFISTSSVSNQNIKINNVTYSHIVNPLSGSSTPLNDAVIVISDKGYLGDALSTAMMMSTINEIKDIEKKYDVKTLIIQKNTIIYQNEDIEVKYR